MSIVLTHAQNNKTVTLCAQTHKHKIKREKTRISRVPVRFSTNRRPRDNNNQNATVIPLLISGRRFSTSLPGRTTTRATHVAHVTQARDSARQRARPETTGESKGQEAQSQNCGQLKVAAKAQKENEQIHHKKQTSKRNIGVLQGSFTELT